MNVVGIPKPSIRHRNRFRRTARIRTRLAAADPIEGPNKGVQAAPDQIPRDFNQPDVDQHYVHDHPPQQAPEEERCDQANDYSNHDHRSYAERSWSRWTIEAVDPGARGGGCMALTVRPSSPFNSTSAVHVEKPC